MWMTGKTAANGLRNHNYISRPVLTYLPIFGFSSCLSHCACTGRCSFVHPLLNYLWKHLTYSFMCWIQVHTIYYCDRIKCEKSGLIELQMNNLIYWAYMCTRVRLSIFIPGYGRELRDAVIQVHGCIYISIRSSELTDMHIGLQVYMFIYACRLYIEYLTFRNVCVFQCV